MNKIRSAWEEQRAAVAGWMQIPGALPAEALAHCGYDGIVVDLQHGATDFAQAAAMFAAIELAGAQPLARLESNDPKPIGKLLDFGAYGIICPMIDTAAQAAAFVAALDYPPTGTRSFGPRRPSLRYGANYYRSARETLVGLAMIETREALKNLDAILVVDGLDGVFIGPTDLALELGAEPAVDSRDPVVVEAVADILRATKAAGKRAGVFCGSSAFAREKIAQGFDLVSAAPDLAMLTAAAKKIVAEIRMPG